MSKTNDRFTIGDTVYLGPETCWAINSRNPLNTEGVVLSLQGKSGSIDWLTVLWKNGTEEVVQSYIKADSDLLTEDEYLDLWRKGASTVGIDLESSTLSKDKMVIDDSGDLTHLTITPSQKIYVKDVSEWVCHTGDTVGIGEVDEVTPIHCSFGKDAITKLADDIYEKARMNLSTSQSLELKDIVLELLNDQDK